jgi:hypothetical protein
LATVAIIDSHAHPSAPAYYDAFDEPLADGTRISVDQIIRLPRMRLDQLLTQMAGLDRGSTVILVCHGANGGLVLPMSENTRTRGFGPDAVAALIRFVEGSGSSERERETAESLRMPAGELRGLRQGTIDTRAKRLARVVFRACNLGKDSTDLDRLRVFFGAAKACAPDIFDSYVTGNPGTPTTNSGTWRAWLRSHAGAVITGSSPNRFAFHRLRRAHSFRFDCLADSWSAVQTWVTSNLGANTLPERRPFPVHALQNGELIFPGQTEYVQHLEEVPGAALP